MTRFGDRPGPRMVEPVSAHERWQRARMLTNLVPLPIARACPVQAMPAVAGDPRPAAQGRDGCPKCGTRGDLGCEHYRPWEAGA